MLKYIVYLNLVIATSAGVLASGVAHFFTIDNYVYYGLFGFFSTLCVYNIQRLIKANKEINTPWLKWVSKHSLLTIIISSISGFLGSYFFIKLLNDITITIVLLIGISTFISLFYVVRIGRKNIREIPHLKIHSIAITWTAVIVLFPILNENISNWQIVTFFILAHYLYFIAVAIPFDIRDLKYDLLTQRTIPQMVGVQNAKVISIILLAMVIVGLGVVSSYLLLTPLFVLAIVIQIFLIAFVTEKHNDFFYSIYIDSAIGLLGVSYLIL